MSWKLGREVGRTVGALLVAQVLTGVETGVLAALLVVGAGLPLASALGASIVAGLPLLAVQAWWLGRRRAAAPSPAVREARLGIGLLVAYTVTAPVVLLGVSAAVGSLLALSLDPAALGRPLRPSDLPGWFLPVTGGLAFGALGLLAVAWQALGDRLRPTRPTLRAGLALHAPRRVDLLVALLCGLSMGWFPAVVAEVLATASPLGGSRSLAWLDASLTHGDAVGRWSMVLLVAVLAPVVEEVVFRGFVWDSMRRWASPAAVVVGTSALFALAHLDPVHSPAVFLIGLVLGSLRWSTGSIVPGIVAHLVNNGLGALVAVHGGSEAGVPLATAIALAGMAVLAATTSAVAAPPRAVPA